MRITLPLKELKVGMYIANPGPEWVELGLYPVEGFINQNSDLEFILKSGSPRAVIDTSRCSVSALSENVLSKGLPEKKPVISKNSFVPKVSMKEELIKARAVYSDSLSKIKNILDDLKCGKKINPAVAEPVVSGIVESLDLNSDALLGLSKLRERDEYTYAHCANVSVLAIMLAKKLQLSKEMQMLIGLGALLHDLGKAKVPSSIINAPRRLTEQEFNIMKCHPSLGYEELSSTKDLPKEILNCILHHHEKLDGSGYPQGLKGKEISLQGELVGIVDVFDALTAKRSYKEAMPMHSANLILFGMRDKAFSKSKIDIFIQMIGVYPLGTPVRLNNGYLGFVCETGFIDPLRPKVRVLRDAKCRSILQHEIDLYAEQEFSIKSTISQKELGCDIVNLLGLPSANRMKA